MSRSFQLASSPSNTDPTSTPLGCYTSVTVATLLSNSTLHGVFHLQIKLTIDADNFQREGHAYLALLIHDIDHQRQLQDFVEA
jgi:hypothetical protein